MNIFLFALLVALPVTKSLAQSDSIYTGQKIDVYVDGLACPFCAHGLDQRFNKMGSIQSVEVDIDKGIMTLDIKKGESITKKMIRVQIEEAGFSLNKIKIHKSEKEASCSYNEKVKLEMFSAECSLCDQTLFVIQTRFPGLPVTVHKASECTDGGCCILADQYGVRAVPSIIVNGELFLTGIPQKNDLDKLEEIIQR